MSVYNGELYLREAMHSVLNQSFSDFEFLVFDDYSQDGTSAILEEFRDPRIKVITNSANQGLTKNLARGMELAKGEFIARMDADDVCELNRLQSQVTFLDNNNQISVVGSAVTFFDGDGWEFVAYQPETHAEIQCTLFYGFTMLHPSVMLRRLDFRRNGLNYDPYFVCSQDHDLWVRASRQLQFANIRQPLLRMREHEAKIGRTQNGVQRHFSSYIRKRQLSELSVTFSVEEFAAFDNAANGDPPTSETDLRSLESLLLRVFRSNRLHSVFDQHCLEKCGAYFFRHQCRAALISRHTWGRYYWRSQLRQFDLPTLRERIGLFYRSAVAFSF